MSAALLLTACPIGQAADDFFDHHVGGSSADTSTSTASSSSAGTSSASSSASGSSSSSAAASTASTTSTGTTSTASTGTTTTDTGETGGPPVCGNGVREGDEECDDADADPLDDCDNACARPYTIFVTSEFGYTGKLNGLLGADVRCRNRAVLAELPRWDHYRALLSDSVTDAADRLHHARGYYRLINGLPVAHGWDALMNAPLENPINVTELSTTLNIGVWTGTGPGGTAIPGAEHCGDWTIEADDVFGHYGSSSEVGPRWLVWDNPKVNPTVCFDNRALYCVEQP